MKKLKLNLGDGGLQGWLIRHVEKFVLVLFAAVMVWFVVSGSRLAGMKTAQAPDELKKKALETQAYVTESRWEAVQQQPERKVEPNVEGKVKIFLASAANSDHYRLDKRWDDPLIPKLMPRRDPAIYGPQHVIAVSVEGPFAYLAEESDVDPLEPAAVEDEDS